MSPSVPYVCPPEGVSPPATVLLGEGRRSPTKTGSSDPGGPVRRRFPHNPLTSKEERMNGNGLKNFSSSAYESLLNIFLDIKFK